MSTDKPKEPFDPDLPSPVASTPVPAPRSCLFYGCVTVSAIGLVAMLAIGITLAVLYSRRDELINRYTATQPMPIPVSVLSPEEEKALNDRVEHFEQARDPSQLITVSLTADELNALIARDEDLRGHLAVQIVGDRIQADVSLPLEALDSLSGILGDMKGRYLNGQALLEPTVEDNSLEIRIRELEVKGKKLPESWLGTISGGTHVRIGLGDDTTSMDSPKEGKLIHKIEAISVHDGKLFLTLRPMPHRGPGPRPPGAPSTPEPPEPPAGPDPTRGP